MAHSPCTLIVTDTQGWVKTFDLANNLFMQIGSGTRSGNNRICLPTQPTAEHALQPTHAQFIFQPNAIYLVNLSNDPDSVCVQRPAKGSAPAETLNLETGQREMVQPTDVIMLCGYTLRLVEPPSARHAETLGLPRTYEGVGSSSVRLSVTLDRDLLLPDGDITLSATVQNLTTERMPILVTLTGQPLLSVRDDQPRMLYAYNEGIGVAFKISHPAARALDQGRYPLYVSVARQTALAEDKLAVATCFITILLFYRYQFVSFAPVAKPAANEAQQAPA